MSPTPRCTEARHTPPSLTSGFAATRVRLAFRNVTRARLLFDEHCLFFRPKQDGPFSGLVEGGQAIKRVPEVFSNADKRPPVRHGCDTITHTPTQVHFFVSGDRKALKPSFG